MIDSPAHTPPPGERTLTVLGNLALMRGFMGVKQTTYSLIITDRRLLFAELTKDKMGEIVGQARDRAKAEGKGRMGQWGAQLRAPSNYHERYRLISPGMALAETPGNFAIDRTAIQKVKFKEGTNDDTYATLDEVLIKTTTGKYKLHVRGSLSTVRDAFRAAGIA